jgi:hypothetical protein
LENALDEKHEMEKHALILASMSTGLGITTTPSPEVAPSGNSIISSAVGESWNTSGSSASNTSPCSGTPSPGSVRGAMVSTDDGSEEEQTSTSSEPASEDPESEKPTKKHKSDTKKRIRTTPDQLRLLEKTYEREKIPSQSLREELALKLGMTPRRVQVWFQNKRAKERRLKKSMKEPMENYAPDYHQFMPAMGISKLSVFPVPVHTYPRHDSIPVQYTTSYPHVYDLNPVYANTTPFPGRYPEPTTYGAMGNNGADWKKLPPLRYICNEM